MNCSHGLPYEVKCRQCFDEGMARVLASRVKPAYPTMNPALRDTVLDLATDVRYWAEARSKGFPEDLNGWCAIASGELFRRLQKHEIAAELHLSIDTLDMQSCHVYVVVDDHVVDVTATQFRAFRKIPVLIMHHREAGTYHFYNAAEIFDSVESLRTYQKKNRWSPREIAYRS